MKKDKKRVFSMIIALMLVFTFALTGCGGSQDDEKSNSSKSASTDTVAPTSTVSTPKLAPYELKVIYPCGVVPNDLGLVQDEMNKQLTEKMNATVSLLPIDWGSWEDKTKLMFVSGDKIDIISSSVGLYYGQNVAKGVYKAMDDLLQKNGQDIINTVGLDFIKGTAISGKIYGIPVLKEKGSSYGFIFNKKFVDKYKFDLSTIKKIQDLEPMLKTIKDNEPGITPLCQSYRTVFADIVNISQLDALGSALGGSIQYGATDLKVMNQYEYAPGLEILDWSHKMYQLGYINKSSLTDKDEGPMKAGKAFVMPYELKPGKDKELEMAWGFPLVQLDMISAPVASAAAAQGIMQSIGATSEDPDRAMMFINALYSDKQLLNTFVFGVEGTHYVKKDENTIDFPTGITAQTIGYKNEAWLFGSQFQDYLWTTEDPKKWEQLKAFNSNIVNSPALGFNFDPESVKTELAAMDSVEQKFKLALFTGAIDPKVMVPKMIAELKASGLEKVMKEKQRQLDEWAKTK